jgi:hypothetical protein
MIEEQVCRAIHVTDQRVTTTFARGTREMVAENSLADKVDVTNARGRRIAQSGFNHGIA